MANKRFPKNTAADPKRTVVEGGRSTENDFIVWCFDLVDRDGEFRFSPSEIPKFLHKEVLCKIVEYGNMTWAQVRQQTHDNGKSKHHQLDKGRLSRAAEQRIRAKRLENDEDALYSFALTNKLRIIGLRRGAEFHVVWYDPEHMFCPSAR